MPTLTTELVISLVVVGLVAAVLAARVSRSARRAQRAEASAAALARGAAELVGQDDPLPQLLEQLRDTFELDAVSLLRHDRGGWVLVGSAGQTPPRRPMSGRSIPIGGSGDAFVVTRGGNPPAEDMVVLRAFVDQLSVALERSELTRETRRLEAADSLRRGILQAVSHDLRTPLAGIKASVTSLLAPDVTFDAQDTDELLHVIDAEVDRLDRVVGNLLDASRIQGGDLPVQLREHALEEIVAGALDGLDPSGDTVAVAVPADLPMVRVDGPLVERAVANVVANALAVQPEGTPVRIAARCDGDRVVLRIQDRGPGIPPAARQRVFEPFQRLGDRSTLAGVGLGLAIARGFTEAVGGELELSDAPGGGLVVAFSLPVAEAPGEDDL